MNKTDSTIQNDLESILLKYCDVIKKGLDERWQKFNIELYESDIYEVIGGLLARQATLAIQFAMAPQIWNGHIAPLILRSMTDAHITLSWIVCEPKERAKKYILYGLGQAKLFLEHLKKEFKEKPEDEQLKRMIDVEEMWLNSQRRDFLTEVNVGSWSGISTREMAKDADCESIYNFAYMPFSGATHNMWQHISFYNLEFCNNPLHKYHKVPTIADTPLDLDFLYRATKYLDRSFRLFDKVFCVKVETAMPLDWLLEKFDDLSENYERMT
jgi:hypothetical protein